VPAVDLALPVVDAGHENLDHALVVRRKAEWRGAVVVELEAAAAREEEQLGDVGLLCLARVVQRGLVAGSRVKIATTTLSNSLAIHTVLRPLGVHKI